MEIQVKNTGHSFIVIFLLRSFMFIKSNMKKVIQKVKLSPYTNSKNWWPHELLILDNSHWSVNLRVHIAQNKTFIVQKMSLGSKSLAYFWECRLRGVVKKSTCCWVSWGKRPEAGHLAKGWRRNWCLFLALKGSLEGWIVWLVMEILCLLPEGVAETIGS